MGNGKPLCEDLLVADQHKDRSKAFRPEPAEYDDGMTVIKQRGWEMDGFLRACLRMLLAEPDKLLGLLAPYRPPSKRRGRPPKQKD